ncbi:MAG: hypothetical protein UU08_C0001G0023 [Candidatus Uhrbacteria bacterium GW2011_GWE2_40_58]|nr:MAG: hypothetical protein UT94_C0001G0023 [Candidatus Uhrbacteria bacterium GW2011_GWF2_40_263]KKR68249.1 MAG: hypothetical protein UU08_C0001G0023 [Candidatus Uhrbacteria bacterium GW2011_GWE2_40_58]OGL92052.1 MAG: hypothetical protein A2239_03500 [Candidatus Uhrbacteria bacterium RIFOXYA2_FULL_40_9]OGL97510.1 MAG: hypothetical protein A2332_00205 [Candidatus Uhrbacteria bacterium RIFOXYB2_FULL_41_18]HBK35103.1 hypothetical protein [Candidatus Uhrbacteria bacterium]
MKRKINQCAFLFFLFACAGITFGFAFTDKPLPTEQKQKVVFLQGETFTKEEEMIPEVVLHFQTPEEVRGLYWTAYTAGTERAKELMDYMKDTGLNAVVIDVKMDDGEIAFTPHNEALSAYAMTRPAIENVDTLLEQLFEAGIYRIARIPVMRDRAFAFVHPEVVLRTGDGGLWYDNIGSVWVDPSASEVADYAIALAREAYARGFDEVQFDYVRFASDGSISTIYYPVYDGSEEKYEVMYHFFERVGGTMKAEGIPVSFDTFGITCWSGDDFNIGQRLIDVFPFANFISPMVYPSHFPDGFEGYGNPALYPYEIVKRSMEECVKFSSGVYKGSIEELQPIFRPWIQDFDIGAVYTSELIEAEIQGARDAGSSGWILWNARNVYEPANYQ